MTLKNANSTSARKHQGDVRQRNNRWFGAGLFSVMEPM
jgi:hypothetical protein